MAQISLYVIKQRGALQLGFPTSPKKAPRLLPNAKRKRRPPALAFVQERQRAAAGRLGSAVRTFGCCVRETNLIRAVERLWRC